MSSELIEGPFGPPADFPYAWLVRVPEVFGLFVAALYGLTYFGPRWAEEWVEGGRMLVTYSILIPGLMQLVALPVGLYAMVYGPSGSRASQVLALACGSCQLSLSSFLVFTDIFSSRS